MWRVEIRWVCRVHKQVHPNLWMSCLKTRPHLYANANKACEAEANAKECQKVAYSVFAAQVNKQAFRWLFVGCPNECTSTSVWLRTYFSLKYRLQVDSIRLFAKHTPHKRMKVNAVCLHGYIMRFACVLCSCTDVGAALHMQNAGICSHPTMKSNLCQADLCCLLQRRNFVASYIMNLWHPAFSYFQLFPIFIIFIFKLGTFALNGSHLIKYWKIVEHYSKVPYQN